MQGNSQLHCLVHHETKLFKENAARPMLIIARKQPHATGASQPWNKQNEENCEKCYYKDRERKIC